MAETSNSAPPIPAQEWDEARIRDSLARLEQLQDQLDALRFIIPSITAAATNRGPSRTAYFGQYRGAAVGGSEELEKFRRDWEDKKTREIFERAKKSREENADMKMAIQVPKYGWVKDEESADGETAAVGHEAGERKAGEDVKKIVERWKEQHSNVNVELEDEDKKVIVVQYTASPFTFRFVITRPTDDADKEGYRVSCEGAKPIFAAMERCIARRPRPDSLNDTLDMLAAYSNLSTAECVSCSRLLDRQAKFPLARRAKITLGATKDVTSWDALHESCLPR